MTVPFTIEEFLGVFAAYNAAIWPAQIAAFGLGLVALAALWRRWPMTSRLISAILALMWALNGIGYHFMFFSTINPAATLFAGLFVLQAILFAAIAGFSKGIRFETGQNIRTFAAAACITYAMLVYPILGIWSGHGLMKGPMFGVSPCPTTIFTIGILLLARGRLVVWLSILPILWSLIGLAAAIQLGIPEDFGLAAAGLVLALLLYFEPSGCSGTDGQLHHDL